VYGANWTPGFFRAFEAQQGYDLRRHLPALVGPAPGRSVADSLRARVRADYKETLDALILNGFAQPWARWTHAQGGIARNQAHGAPGNLLDLYAAADIPETETFHPSGFDIPGLRRDSAFVAGRAFATRPDPLLFKFASSAAHLSGDPLTASETATWLGEHFRVSLAQVKPEVDQLLTAGINHVFYHGTPYSPPDARWPGWLFYASTHFAPTNPFWRDLPALNDYIARAQSFLQTGRPDHDVLLYFPMHDVWHRPDSTLQLSVYEPEAWFYDTPVHGAASMMRERGYTFDYVSDRLLDSVAVADGRLQGPAGPYATVLVPRTQYMPLETLERTLALARDGATVAFEALPADVPGWGRLAERRQRRRTLLGTLRFTSGPADGVRRAPVGQGRVLLGDDVEALLRAAGAAREPMADRGLTFARRTRPGGRHYFIANLTSEPVDGWVPLATPAASAVLFDPMTERRGVAAVREGDGGRASVYLQLRPGESAVLRTFAGRASVDGPRWPYGEPGRPVRVDGPWSVSFVDGGPVLPDRFTTDSLASWTEIGPPEARRFSGTARYTVSFEAPERPADRWRLDLGRVRESARVVLNGTDLGRAVAHPFDLPVRGALRPDTNRLTIEVTNLMANRIVDLERRGVEWKKFYDINVVGLDYEPFDASDWAPMPSGLLGPVRLVPITDRRPGGDAGGGNAE
jgi:hypothetical protein